MVAVRWSVRAIPSGNTWAHEFPALPGDRQIIVLDIESIMTTCGFAVPRYEFIAEREQLAEFTCKMGEQKMDEYRHQKNQRSIDGLPTYLFADPTSK